MAKAEAKQIDSKTDVLNDVKGYARKIWLAGLGAYAKAGKEGFDYVKELVKAGEGLEKKGSDKVTAVSGSLNSVKERVAVVKERVAVAKERVAEVKEKVDVRFEKVEQAFDRRVASGLNRMGIPSRRDIDELSAKLDALTALVERAAKAE
jgi:poly(hydroxyalkanoate) granule-associated protein